MFSCKRENAFDCFKTNGDYHEETRNVGAFKTISVNNQINIKIYKSQEHKVIVKAGKNVISNIVTKVENDELIIENKNQCNFVRGYKHKINIDILTPYLTHIDNLGVGTIEVDNNFSQDTIVARIESSGDIYINGTYNEIRTSTHGNGDMHLSGSTNTFYVYTNGLNFVYAENLLVKDFAFIQTISIGDCYLNASQLKSLDYSIQSSGNLYYSGEPQKVHAGGNGKGKAIKK